MFGSWRTKTIMVVCGCALSLSTFTLPVHAQDATAGTVKAGDLIIANIWIKAPPAGAKVSGGYATIVNRGKEADRLIGASIPQAGKAEVHEMTIQDNIMRMRALDNGLEIGPGATAKLMPGSYHIMFLDLKQLPAEGQWIPGELVFSRAGKVPVVFHVRSMAGQSDKKH